MVTRVEDLPDELRIWSSELRIWPGELQIARKTINEDAVFLSEYCARILIIFIPKSYAKNPIK